MPTPKTKILNPVTRLPGGACDIGALMIRIGFLGGLFWYNDIGTLRAHY